MNGWFERRSDQSRLGARSGARCLLIALCLCSVAAGGATLDEAVDVTQEGNAAAAKSQELIEKLSDNADQLAAEYRRTLQETDSLRTYNQQLETLIASQSKEMDSLQKQIDGVSVLGRQVTPLMLRMIDALDEFVRLDVPFLPDERRERINGLRTMMDRSDVSLSEKYRRLMEAYQIENEYGRTIEAYRGTLDIDGQSRTVDFLRIGRIALLYQTLDGQEAGVWNPSRKVWEKLPGEYRSPVREGLQIARKQIAPDLIRIPVSAPQEAK